MSGEALYGDILAFIAAGIITAYFSLANMFVKICHLYRIRSLVMEVAPVFLVYFLI